MHSLITTRLDGRSGVGGRRRRPTASHLRPVSSSEPASVDRPHLHGHRRFKPCVGDLHPWRICAGLSSTFLVRMRHPSQRSVPFSMQGWDESPSPSRTDTWWASARPSSTSSSKLFRAGSLRARQPEMTKAKSQRSAPGGLVRCSLRPVGSLERFGLLRSETGLSSSSTPSPVPLPVVARTPGHARRTGRSRLGWMHTRLSRPRLPLL